MPDRDPDAVRQLLKPAAVRERAHEMLRLGLEGRLMHFAVHPERLEAFLAGSRLAPRFAIGRLR